MTVLNIEGKKVTVDDSFLSLSPEQQADTVDEIASQIGVTAAPKEQPESDQSKAVRQDLSNTMQKFMDGNDGAARNVDSFMRGAADTATFGMADEIAAIGNSTNPLNQEGTWNKIASAITMANPVTNIMQQGKELIAPSEKTKSALREERAFQAQRDDADPYASTTGRVAGGLLSGIGLTKAGAPFMGALPADAGLAAKVAQSAKAGALYSGLYGLGSGTDAADRITEGAKSAATGAVIGGAIPLVAATVGAVTRPIRNAIKGYAFPDEYAAQKVAERLDDAGLSVDQAAAKMAKTPGLSLADVSGKPVQNLLKTTTNIPGKAQARVQTQLAQKAMQQGDRIRTAIKTMFADPDGYLAAKDDIADTAKTLAGPLYKQAYETPVPFTKSLEDILDTPAGQAALAQAERLAANEQQPFQQFFINMTSPTTGTVRRVPDARAWDYIKRGFDDVIDSQKAGMFGKSNNETRILMSLKNKMLSEIDDVNPAYAAARKIWSGQASLDNALEAGRSAMTQSPEATKRIVADMSSAEKESFKIGVADWLRNQVGKTGFTNNALLKFFANRDQLANLRAAFDDDAQFKAFRQAMFAEARKRSTYNVVTGNSSTAKQLADMAESGGLRETADFVKNAATGNIVGGALNFIGSRMRMLGGFTPEVADSVAKKLMATNPQQVKAIASQLRQIEQSAISADQKRQFVFKLIAPLISEQATAARRQ